MGRPSVHPFTLRFRDLDTEAVFREDYERRSRPLVRAALILGLVQYAAFGWLDRWVAPMALDEIRTVRVAVCAVITLGIVATYVPRLRRWVRPAVTVGLAGGLGVVAMEWAVQHAIHTAGRGAPSGGLLILDGYYYSGMMLILIYVHVLLRLRFVTATGIGAGLILLYLAVAAVHTPPLQLANAAQFLLSTQLSGMVASYALERYARSRSPTRAARRSRTPSWRGRSGGSRQRRTASFTRRRWRRSGASRPAWPTKSRTR